MRLKPEVKQTPEDPFSAPIDWSSNSTNEHHLRNSTVKLPVKISNLVDGKQMKDTLHRVSKPMGCSGHYCVGSLMSGNADITKSTRTKADVLEEALDFFEQYLIHLKKDSDELSKRLKRVTTELEQNDTFSITRDELEFGAKTAWRNNSRCIGRAQWNQLQIQDCRNVKTTYEMFSAICEHIRTATNNGIIKPLITVFPQRIPGREDFRIWNQQLIGFAGYLQPDGEVIGDKGRVQFTQICQRLGWKGKGGRFDVLPIVVSAPDEGVKYYDIPEELVLLIEMEHPRFEWFKDLGLKWYALPAVSDMQLDVGGLQFTAAPFNGWYMGTEIGARDFCDVQRYNLLDTVALRMGLDVTNTSSLWRDTVLVEINIAVLYSFQRSGVTIVDHHTASNNFIRHMNIEQKQRGGCPADWVWIVPPISGSITQVFHQEMLNYSLKPSYEYQEKAWFTYSWEASRVSLKLTLKSVVRGAICASILMNSILSKRVKATILFATETGASEAFARKAQELMKKMFSVDVKCMCDYPIERIHSENFVIIITSTFGNGEAPENGKELWKQMNDLKRSPVLLQSLKYAVFALGSSQYTTFCAFGRNVDKILKEMGAERVNEVGIGDELNGQSLSFETWIKNTFQKSCKFFNLKFDDESLKVIKLLGNCGFNPGEVRLKEVSMDPIDCEEHLMTEMSNIHKKAIFPCNIVSRDYLQPDDSEKQTLLVRMKPSNPLARTFLLYEPGDHIAVFPRNPPKLVEKTLRYIRREGYDLESTVFQVEVLNGEQWEHYSLPPCTLRFVLTNYLDISMAPSQKFLELLSNMANDNWDAFRLQKLAINISDYQKWKSFRYPTLPDVLNEFPSVHVTPEFLLTQLPLIQPRYYSISSYQAPDEVHLTTSLVCQNVGYQKKSTRFGLCTGFFNHFPSENVACFIRKAPGFHLPSDIEVPIIMIGAGSGIAPFRSFWREREVQLLNGAKKGRIILFYGCRTSFDNIYSNELNEMMSKGVINDFFLVTSREEPRKYVQEELITQSSLIYSLVVNNYGHVYVCGDALMADGVKKAFAKVIEIENGDEKEESQHLLHDFMNCGRYHEDVFGAVDFSS